MIRSMFGYLLVSVLVGTATGQIMPLAPGFHWEYHASGDEVWTIVNLGEAEFQGAACMEQLYDLSGGSFPQQIRQYWSADAGGDVYYHGAVSDVHTVAFDPPVLEFDVPFYPGKTWTTVTFNGISVVDFTYAVQGTEVVTVPAGTFEVTRIACFFNSDFQFYRYVADGVGLVYRGVYELVDYGPTVAVRSQTLSEVKRLFR